MPVIACHNVFWQHLSLLLLIDAGASEKMFSWDSTHRNAPAVPTGALDFQSRHGIATFSCHNLLKFTKETWLKHPVV
jgi:hypothetical protein